MKYNRIIALLLIVFTLSCNSAEKKETSENNDYIKLEGTALGTFFHITYLSPENKNFAKEIDSLFVVFNASLSTYQENSIISKVNRNIDVELDNYFITCFNKSREVFEKTDGAFDITVAPLVNMYGFGFSEKGTISQAKIDSLLQFVGMEKVKIVGNKVVKENPGCMLDENAIAKGYCVDIIANFLYENNCENYMVEIGGEVVIKGKNPKNTQWRIGIDKPIEDTGIEKRELQDIIHISDCAVATSGNYRRFYEEDGIKYSHSIDPKTGKPARQKLLSSTIVAKDCMTADAYATACMILGLEKSVKLIESMPELDAYFISSGEKGEFIITKTSGMKKYTNDN